MVGLVIVSHSAALADGVTELAREMGGGEVAIEAAGGMEGGEIGTDAERVRQAVERVRSPDGVLVLMDLGSALMSAEMATEMAEPGGGEILLSEAPLVEGAVAAAALAGAGASLEEVAREARGALRMKTEQLGTDGTQSQEEQPAGGEPAGEEADEPAAELRVQVENKLGLHARPAARFVAALGGLDARIEVSNATRDRGPADGRSLIGVATLAVGQGDEIVVRARGPQAAEALDALRALASKNFGEAPEGQPAMERAPAGADRGAVGDGAEADRAEAAEAPGPGTRLPGVPASPGIAIGPARRLSLRAPVVQDEDSGPPDEERARLAAAREAVRGELEEARSTVASRGGAEAADIFSAQAVLLDDAALTEPALRLIDEGTGAARAWQAAASEAAEAFRALDDPYMRERAVDVEDVSTRVLVRLGGAPAAGALEGPGIVLADELTPGEAAGLDVDPGEKAIAERRAEQEAEAERRRTLLARAREPGAMRDGRSVEIFANIGSAAEAARAVEQGAEGVGLLRTEFLFLDRATPPSEEEQVEVLSEIARALEGRPVVVRTLDAGADKPLPFLRQEPESNPFLGRRGIRLSLAEPELLRTQLRAILRVAEEHPLKVMFPMVATLEEVRAARSLLAEAREALGTRAELEVGVMVEVPALALGAGQFAPEVDFFSVGTNDLAQYTMAAERGNGALADLLEASSVPVLSLIARVTEAADEHGRWVGVCGELAGEPEAAVLLAGLGVRELSMAPGRIPAVKAALRESDMGSASAAARRALESARAPWQSRS